MSTFERVKNWNIICGKNAPEFGTIAYYQALANQSKRIEEELKELDLAVAFASTISDLMSNGDVDGSTTIEIDGVQSFVDQEALDHWNQEILDAGCDLDVVVAGVNFLSGHDYDGAIDAVLDNNDVKYTVSKEFAEETLSTLSDDHHIVTTETILDVDELRTYLDESEIASALTDGGYVIRVDDSEQQALYYAEVYSVHRISDDKICKMIGHPKVDLAPYVGTK